MLFGALRNYFTRVEICHLKATLVGNCEKVELMKFEKHSFKDPFRIASLQ